MAHDHTIPLGKPGIASFESETYGNAGELLYGDTPARAERHQTVTTAEDIDFPLGAVVSIDADGVITMAQWIAESGGGDDPIVPAHSNATHILASPLVMAENEEFDVPCYEAGHFRQQALTWDDSFDTDAKKQNAFKGSATPMILISKAKYDDADFPA